MLNENDVIEAVCAYLPSQDYRVVGKKKTTQQGTDIVAMNHSGARLFVEAKGETSSKRKSARYGKPFNASQLFDHTAKALYTTTKLRCLHPQDHVALAFPAHAPIRTLTLPIMPALALLRIDVLWVNPQGEVFWEKCADNEHA